MIRTKSLHFQYPNGQSLSFPDLQCESGEHWLLLGQSGSGKTTLLHLLAGLRRPSGGRILIQEQDITTLKGERLDRFRGKQIGLVFQRSNFVRALTVRENLELAQRLAGTSVDRVRIRTLLDQLDIGTKAKRRPDQLSVGEQQRVAIARALVNRPAVILADEPTSALDDRNADRVAGLLEETALSVNATLLVVTHDGRLKDRFPKRIELTSEPLPTPNPS